MLYKVDPLCANGNGGGSFLKFTVVNCVVISFAGPVGMNGFLAFKAICEALVVAVRCRKLAVH